MQLSLNVFEATSALCFGDQGSQHLNLASNGLLLLRQYPEAYG